MSNNIFALSENTDLCYPEFSVSMSVYRNDKPEYFKEAVDSVLNQTVIPTEIVLVVDGPIPNEITRLIETYQNENLMVKPIWLKENVGHGEARRTGLLHCKYELVALMDSDDISLPYRFEKQLRCFMNDMTLSVVGGQIREFLENDRENYTGVRLVKYTNEGIRKQLEKQCPINQVSVMFRKSSVLEAGGYRDWYNNEDYYLWIRMFMKGCRFKNLKDVLVDVRVGADMYHRRGGVEYFKSEVKLQKFMLANKIITKTQYLLNVAVRLIVQVLSPNWLRGFMFRKIFRKKIISS